MASRSHPPRAVVVLPAGQGRGPELVQLLTGEGVPVLPENAVDVDVVVADLEALGAPGLPPAFQERWPRAAVLGVAPPSVPTDLSVVDVVDPRALQAELVPRLRRLRERLGTLHEAQLRQRDLQVLLELTGRYAESTNLEELLHGVTKRLADEVGVDRVALLTVDAEKGTTTIVAASDDPALKELKLELARYPEIQEVVRTGKPVLVEDAESHPLLEGVKASVVKRGIRAIAALPLVLQGRQTGVLLLRRFSERGAFAPREVEFLTTVAHATAIAFRNVRQLESVRGQRELEKAGRIAAESRAAALERYAAYFHHLSDGVAILSREGRVLSLNPAGAQLLDVGQLEARGRPIVELTQPLEAELLAEVLYSVGLGQVRTDVDLKATTPAGRKLTLAVSAAPLGDEAGEGEAILTLRDVTRPRLLADELEQTKTFLERLVQGSVDGIVACDMTGQVILFNRAAEEILGWSATDALGQLNATAVYTQGVAQEIMKRLRSEEYGGKGRLNSLRTDLRSREGAVIPVSMTAFIIYEGQREVATVGIFTDLRDRLSLERRLTDAEARVLESEKNSVLVALAGTTAHELNQPLTSVMGYAELLKRKLQEGDPLYKPVDIIHREAERMSDIVKRIGRITRFETKSYVGSAQILDLSKAVNEE